MKTGSPTWRGPRGNVSSALAADGEVVQRQMRVPRVWPRVSTKCEHPRNTRRHFRAVVFSPSSFLEKEE